MNIRPYVMNLRLRVMNLRRHILNLRPHIMNLPPHVMNPRHRSKILRFHCLSEKASVRTRGGHVGKSSRTGKILKQNSETETDVAGQGKRRRVRTRGGSASSITHQLRTGRDLCQIYSVQVPIEEELSAILNDNDERDNCARAQFQAQELSDKQLLDILEASDDNFDDEVLDENFLNNFDDSDSDDDNMIPTETFAPPTSDGECLNWSDQISHIKDIAFIGNPMGLNVQLEATEPINFF
ncbi:unnamed protein product [Parnassius apollo]|uniref:(apollo) hypothetical protein n=1 Tax=Parnassius apollo TaxID=110799 RepID=A0A8S3W2U1_PARAO|nr:unnamed protein product [Parnassius apollo]